MAVVERWPSAEVRLNKGSKGGAVVRALASHQCSPGSTPGVDAICGLSLLFVLSLALRGFSPGTPVFPSPQKPTFPNSNSTRNQVDEEPLCGCATCKSLFIYLLIFIYNHHRHRLHIHHHLTALYYFFQTNPFAVLPYTYLILFLLCYSC